MRKTIKRTVVIPDLQVPYHDAHAVRNIAAFLKVFKHDSVVILGDEIDLPQISKWEENKMGWFEQTLDQHRNEAVEVIWSLTQYAKEAHITRSNHTDRLYNVIMRKIPAFLALPELRYDKFMRFDELGVTYEKKPYAIAKGWIAIHGDEGSISPHAGLTSLGHARKMGFNVICGHTHRAGQSAFTEASAGVLRRVHRGVDSGHLMDMKQAHYTRGTANWQQAFQVMTEDAKGVQIDMINIEKDGTFIVHGKRYGRAR